MKRALGKYTKLSYVELEYSRGMVVYGQDKLDEISMEIAPTRTIEIRDGWFSVLHGYPGTVRLYALFEGRADGRTPEENAKIHT